MDTLSELQQESVRKMSDERLRNNLTRAGSPPTAVNALDRAPLLSAWAELIATGRDKPVDLQNANATLTLVDPELERRRFEFEERKWAEEFQLEAEKI